MNEERGRLPPVESPAGPWGLLGNCLEQIPDAVFALEGVAERNRRIDRVVVAPADLLSGQVSGIDQIANYSLGRPFGDPYSLGYVTDAGLGIPSEDDHCVPVVGKEGPFRHGPSLASPK